MRRFGDGWLGRVRVGTSMTMLMYLLPPILRQLKTDHPQLEINLKAGLTATTLQMLKTNALDLGLCALPIEDPAFEAVPLVKDELVAILPAELGPIPKKVTPAFLSRCPLILGSEKSALRRTIAEWLALAGPPPRPLMEFDNVEAMKSVVAVGLGASIVPSLSLGAGHIPTANMLGRPRARGWSRRVGLGRLRGTGSTEGMELVSAALLSLRPQRSSSRSILMSVHPWPKLQRFLRRSPPTAEKLVENAAAIGPEHQHHTGQRASGHHARRHRQGELFGELGFASRDQKRNQRAQEEQKPIVPVKDPGQTE